MSYSNHNQGQGQGHFHGHVETGVPEIDQAHDEMYAVVARIKDCAENQGGQRQIRELLGEAMSSTRRHYNREVVYVQRHCPEILETYRGHYRNMIEELLDLAVKFEQGFFLSVEDFVADQIKTLFDFTFTNFCLKITPALKA